MLDAAEIAASLPATAAVVILVEPAGLTVIGDVGALPSGLREAVENSTRAPGERLCTCAIHGDRR